MCDPKSPDNQKYSSPVLANYAPKIFPYIGLNVNLSPFVVKFKFKRCTYVTYSNGLDLFVAHYLLY